MREITYICAALIAFSTSTAAAAEFSLTSQHAEKKSTICLSRQAISIDDAILKKIGGKARKLKVGNTKSLITIAHGRITERASTGKRNVCVNKFKQTADS